MAKNKAIVPTRADQLPPYAQSLVDYRRQPSLWIEDHINIELARCRERAELEEWLLRQPAESHSWCRANLAADKLSLGNASYQSYVLDAMAEPGQYALQWANGCAKTATAALFLLWFLDCYPGGKALTTAGTWSQLKEQLWREIPMWAERLKRQIVPMGDAMLQTSIDLGPDWAAFARAADRADTFEGVHGDYILILVDEAKAIKAEIFGAFRRIMRGNPNCMCWIVCLSSPGSPIGPFYDITNGDQAHRWKTFKLSAYESERITLDQIATDAEDLGEESPLFISMDLGEFPTEGEDTVIPLSWAQAAINRVVTLDGPNFLGIDCARLGLNETIMASLKGRTVKLERTYRGKDLVWTFNTAMELHTRDRYRSIGTDDAGLGGGVTDQLKSAGLPVVPVIGGGKEGMRQPLRYVNLNAEMWFSLRAELEAGFNDLANPEVGLCLPPDKRLINQLVSARYGYDDQSRRRLEKKKLKKTAATEGGDSDSPDRADAVVIANWMRAGLHTSQGTQVHKALLDSVNDGYDRGGLAASLIRDIG